MITDLEQIKPGKKLKSSNGINKNNYFTPLYCTNSKSTSIDSYQGKFQGQVIKRVLHTRTEITIYPNGQTYQSSKSWFEDKTYVVKKKQKKTVKAKQVKKEDEEVY